MTCPAAANGRAWAAAAALAVVVAAVFAPAVRNGFVMWDDPFYVTDNPEVLGGLTVDGVTWAFTTLHAANWHPLTWLSLQLDATVFGPGPAGFHATNVALHAANAGLLFLVLRQLTGAAVRSFAVALLWAVHPLRVESVAWVTERKDVLSGLFFLLAIEAFRRYTVAYSRAWFYAALGAATASLLAKPMAVTLPCVLLLLDAWPLGRLRSTHDLPRLVWEKTPFFLVAVLSCAATMFAQADAGSVHTLQGRSAADRLLTALTGYGAYLRLTAWPDGLAAIYPISPRPLWQPAAAAAVITAITVCGVAGRRRAPYLLVGWLWFLGMLVPVIGLVQVGEQAYADRYTYLPQIGLMISVVWGAADLTRRATVPRWARWVVVGVVVAVSVVGTERQFQYWAGDRALWERVVAVNPDAPKPRLTLAYVCLSEKDYDTALLHAEAAYRLSGYSQAYLERLGIMIVTVENKRARQRRSPPE
jgi:hypothetical protein